MVKVLLIQEYDKLTSLNKAITPNNLTLTGKQWGEGVLDVSRVLKHFSLSPVSRVTSAEIAIFPITPLINFCRLFGI